MNGLEFILLVLMVDLLNVQVMAPTWQVSAMVCVFPCLGFIFKLFLLPCPCSPWCFPFCPYQFLFIYGVLWFFCGQFFGLFSLKGFSYPLGFFIAMPRLVSFLQLPHPHFFVLINFLKPKCCLWSICLA